MFKHYLTYTIALNFQRSCRDLIATPQTRDRLTQSAATMVTHFARSIHTRDRKEESRCLFVALTCLRDTGEIITDAKLDAPEVLWNQYEILHTRLEQICSKVSHHEYGQLRMLD